MQQIDQHRAKPRHLTAISAGRPRPFAAGEGKTIEELLARREGPSPRAAIGLRHARAQPVAAIEAAVMNRPAASAAFGGAQRVLRCVDTEIESNSIWRTVLEELREIVWLMSIVAILSVVAVGVAFALSEVVVVP